MKSRALSAILVFFLLMSRLEYQSSLVPNSYNWKRKKLSEQCSQIKCLVLGSSHSYFGINPAIFSLKTFNIANTSQSLALDTAIIKHFIDELPQLHTIIIPISDFSLEYRLLDSPEDWRDCYSFHFLGVSEAPWWQIFTNVKYLSLICLYGPKKMQELIAHNFSISYAQDISPTGWYCGEDKHVITQEAAVARAKINQHAMRTKNLEKNIACLKEVLAVCNRRNIKIVFVTTPVHPYYFQSMDIGRWAQSQKIIRTLCQKYKSIYLDHLQDQNFTGSDFRDTDHLSKVGATRFSQLLNKQIVEMTL